MAFLALLLARPAAAIPTIFTPEVEQCEGNFAAGSESRKESPQIQVKLQDSAAGLKIGQQRLPTLGGSVRALWRFDTQYQIVPLACALAGAISTRTWRYDYNDVNGSATLELGRCLYSTTSACGAAVDASWSLVAGSINPVPIGGCPANPFGLPLAPTNVAIPTAGKFAEALNFQSAFLHRASTGDLTQWDMPNSYTLSAWINTTTGGLGATGVLQRIVSQQGGGNFWGFGLNGSCLKRFDSRERTTPTDERDRTICSTQLNNGAWHLVTVSRTNGFTWRWYIDGILISTTVAQSTVSFSNQNGNGISGDLEVGRFGPGNSEFFNGLLDEVRVHPGALFDDTVLLEFNAAVHRFSSDAGASFTLAYPASPYFPSTPSNATTGLVTYRPAVQPQIGTQHKYIFYAQNAGSTSTVSSPSYGVTVDKSTPSAPNSFAGAASSPLDIAWSWALPTKICGPPTANSTYTLVDANSGATIANPVNAIGFNENFPLDPPNQLRSRQLKVSDFWGTSALSNSATVYTHANLPTSLAASNISTGSLVLSWSSNSNPPYTRYQLSMSPDGFTNQVSTPAEVSDNFTGVSKAITGLAPGTNYSFRVRAVNGRAEDNFGGLFTAAATLSLVSLPGVPLLSGTALSGSALKWDWSNVPGASGYRLFAAGGSPLMVDTAGLTFTSTTLSTNTAYGAELESYNASGASLRSSPIFVFTRSTQPALPVFTGVSTTTIGLSWSGNTNPAYTFYEVTVATDPVFGVVVATRTGAQTSMAVSGLFPATTYFARVRSLSGGQIPSAFILAGSTRTDVNPAVATGTSPASAYAGAGGLIGVWHFDESTGTLALDSSGLNNNAALTCLANACASTPTYAAGPASLGSAVSFSGLPDSLIQAPDAAQYNFGGSLSVGAWVKPATLAQPNGAALVAKGTATGEAFSLDVFGGKYRFLAKSGFAAAIATSSIRAGHYDHVMGVYNAATGEASLYVNGILSNNVAGVTAPRNINSRPLAIGSRQSGGASSSHDLGFAGSIDEVRLFNVALDAAQARADYLGSFPGEISLPPPASGVRLTLPPNAFGAPSLIYASADPFNHPIRIPLSFLADGLSSLPTGLVLIPGSLIEIVPTVGGLPFTANLGSSATISMPYADSNGDSLVDGLQPPVAVQTLRLYTLDTSVIRWEALPTTVDKANKRVSGLTAHFSIFALFGASTIGASLSQVRAFPNPWLRGSQGRFDAPSLSFDNLPAEGFVRILTLSGERVRELPFSGANAGRLEWDGKNSGGRAAASGVYFALVKAAGTGETSVIKFAIER